MLHPVFMFTHTLDSMSKSRIEKYLEQQGLLVGDTLFFPSTEEVPSHGKTRIDEAPTLIQTDPEHHEMKQSTQWQTATDLAVLDRRICTCIKCSLGATRTKFVFGTGNPKADIVVIGEAPGADEDARGEPFVGRAGQLLTKILEAVQLQREDVFICNILKCRPPGNRRPLPEEVEQCEPYLFKQLELIQPKFILALGLTAVSTLTKINVKMADVRGSFYSYRDIRMLVTYHPAALLRNPEWKRAAWEDIQLLRRSYDDFKATGRLPDVRPLPVG